MGVKPLLVHEELNQPAAPVTAGGNGPLQHLLSKAPAPQVARDAHAFDLAAFHAIARKAGNEGELQAAYRHAAQLGNSEILVAISADSVKGGQMPGSDAGFIKLSQIIIRQ